MSKTKATYCDHKFKDLTGLRFGRLTVLGVVSRPAKRIAWHCRCDCGRFRTVRGSALTSGNTKGCGWHRRATRETSPPHGMSKTLIYGIWRTMLSRCRNPKFPTFKRYGARGVRVCERWYKFENFLSDMGPRPSDNHSLDRIDNAGNYEPGNVRWATKAEQNLNRRPVWTVARRDAQGHFLPRPT